MQVLVTCVDLVAVDSMCAWLMGVDPQKVSYPWLAGWAAVDRAGGDARGDIA